MSSFLTASHLLTTIITAFFSSIGRPAILLSCSSTDLVPSKTTKTIQTKSKEPEIIPEWFNKDIKEVAATKEEIEKLESRMKRS